MPPSPSKVADTLEYLTVESYAWPKPTERRQNRLDEDIRKRRHRENQRRHVLRKKAKLTTLRHVALLTHLQFKYVRALCEEKMLWEERRRLNTLQSKLLAMESDRKLRRQGFEPLDVPRHDASGELDILLVDVLLSL